MVSSSHFSRRKWFRRRHFNFSQEDDFVIILIFSEKIASSSHLFFPLRRRFSHHHLYSFQEENVPFVTYFHHTLECSGTLQVFTRSLKSHYSAKKKNQKKSFFMESPTDHEKTSSPKKTKGTIVNKNGKLHVLNMRRFLQNRFDLPRLPKYNLNETMYVKE